MRRTIYCVALLLLIVSVSSYLYFIEPTALLHLQRYVESTIAHETTALREKKQMLRDKLDALENETKAMANLMEIEKEIRRQLNATVVEKTKLLEQEMASRMDKHQAAEQLIRQLQKQKKLLHANATLHRHFFNNDSRILYNTSYPGAGDYKRYTAARLGLLPLTGIERLRPEFGLVVNNVTRFRYVMSVAPCQKPANVHQSAVFIAVLSKPDNFGKRDLIRQTWKTHLKAEHSANQLAVVGFAFVVGRVDVKETQSKIEEENKKFGDMIQIETPDCATQSLKMAGLFHWLYANCSPMHMLLKVDDDVYVNVRNLANLATQYRPRFNDSVFGTTPPTFATKRTPANSSHSYEEWPWSHYPPHLLGHAVLFANSTILPLLAAIQTTPRVVSDDLYYTGICREKAGIRIANSSSFMATKLPENATPCYLRQFITLLTSNETLMKNWHVATDDFYRNKTFCLVPTMNATMNATVNATVNATNYHNQLFTFNFTDANV